MIRHSSVMSCLIYKKSIPNPTSLEGVLRYSGFDSIKPQPLHPLQDTHSVQAPWTCPSADKVWIQRKVCEIAIAEIVRLNRQHMIDEQGCLRWADIVTQVSHVLLQLLALSL